MPEVQAKHNALINARHRRRFFPILAFPFSFFPPPFLWQIKDKLPNGSALIFIIHSRLPFFHLSNIDVLTITHQLLQPHSQLVCTILPEIIENTNKNRPRTFKVDVNGQFAFFLFFSPKKLLWDSGYGMNRCKDEMKSVVVGRNRCYT